MGFPGSAKILAHQYTLLVNFTEPGPKSLPLYNLSARRQLDLPLVLPQLRILPEVLSPIAPSGFQVASLGLPNQRP